MLAKLLGNVLYWFCCAISMFIVLLCCWTYWIVPESRDHFATVAAFNVGGAIIVWIIGLACRHALSASNSNQATTKSKTGH